MVPRWPVIAYLRARFYHARQQQPLNDWPPHESERPHSLDPGFP
jgi:hypothetical protein